MLQEGQSYGWHFCVKSRTHIKAFLQGNCFLFKDLARIKLNVFFFIVAFTTAGRTSKRLIRTRKAREPQKNTRKRETNKKKTAVGVCCVSWVSE